jgi:endo-1,4-beta-xylanase
MTDPRTILRGADFSLRRASARPALALLLAAAAWGQPLRDLAAQRGVLIGAAVNPDYFAEAPYAATLAGEFTQVQPENDLKFDATERNPGVFSFTRADAILKFAHDHNMKMRGHTLVWYQQNPAWLNGLAPAAIAQAMHNHIANVVGHYAGQIYAWDVVNEAFNDNGTPRTTLWSVNDGYIEQAFRWAREADANALLFYNDYNGETVNSKSDAIYKMVQDFKARGVPIDGVGLQMHFTAGEPSMASIEANIKRLTDLGLQVQITEFDVRLPVDSSGAATAASLATQAKIYGDVVTVCLKFPGCTAIQTWGLTDKHSWIPGSFPNFGAALPFDTAYAPKPAHDAMISSMRTAPPVISAAGLVNAAAYTGGAVAPGEIVVLFGATFGPADIATAGVRVLFDGIPAPLIYARVGQVAAVTPFELAGKTSTTVQYEYQGVVSNSVVLPVHNTAPGVFTLDASGTGPGAILNAATYAVISKTNPAHTGDYLAIYATGIGNAVSVTIGGVNCPVQYAGQAPGLIAGAGQINIQVPAGIPAGEQELVVTASGAKSQPGVIVSIR